MKLAHWVRPHLLQLKPYTSARDEFTGTAEIYLDANENPFSSASQQTYNRYPDPHQREVKQALAQLKGVAEAQIFLGNGSDEPIDLLIRLFCQPDKEAIVITPPTYGMYAVSANINQVAVREVPLTANFALQPKKVVAAAKAAGVKMIFLCSPNNPSGNLLDRSAIAEVLQGFNGPVVVDEAYVDFSTEPSWLHELHNYPNLIVLQTFSKAWGMAGLRLGMAFAQPAIIELLNQIKPPYNINQLTQQEALKALTAHEVMQQHVQKLIGNREKLIVQLAAASCVEKIFPSDANFVLARVTDADALYRYLVEKNIIVRNRSKVLHGQNCLRFTVGTAEENEKLLQALASWNS